MLFDGTKLLGRDQFNEAKRHAELDDEQMALRFNTFHIVFVI